MAAKDKPKVTNAEEIALEERANKRMRDRMKGGMRHPIGDDDRSATERDYDQRDLRVHTGYKGDGRPSLKRSALYDLDKPTPVVQVATGQDDSMPYESRKETEGMPFGAPPGKYRMPVEDRLPRTKTLYGPGSPTDIMGTSEQESTGLKKGGKVKAPKKFSRGGGIEVRGKTKGRFV